MAGASSFSLQSSFGSPCASSRQLLRRRFGLVCDSITNKKSTVHECMFDQIRQQFTPLVSSRSNIPPIITILVIIAFTRCVKKIEPHVCRQLLAQETWSWIIVGHHSRQDFWMMNRPSSISALAPTSPALFATPDRISLTNVDCGTSAW